MTIKDVLYPTDQLVQVKILAHTNTDESWQQVDDMIKQEGFCDKPEVWQFASEVGLYDNDPNIWDLSATILAATTKHKGNLPEKTTNRLKEILSVDITQNPQTTYARYRSAFALYEHNIKDEHILSVIQEATGDEAVKDIALEYLNQSE